MKPAERPRPFQRAIQSFANRAIKPLSKTRFTLVGLSLAVLSLSGCSGSANIDEIFMRGHFHIPEGTKLVSSYSSPTHPIFGRENLFATGEFQFNDEQYERFLARVKPETTWNKLPIAETLYLRIEETDRFRQSNLKRFDAVKNGYYVCETTSKIGIMSEGRQKLPVAFFAFPPATPDGDFVLGVLDCDKKTLSIILKQDY